MEYKTKQQKAESYAKSKARVNELEKNEQVIMYKKWETLSSSERSQCYQAWDEYLLKVRNTKVFKVYTELSEAFKQNNMPKVHELLKENERLKEELLQGNYEVPKPKLLNPYDFMYSQAVTNYKNGRELVKKMESESKDLELAGVFM